MKLKCSIALALGLLIQPTSSKADYMYSGVGATSCGKLVQDRQNPTQIENLMMTWAQGFMSGANAAYGKGQYRDLAAMTLEAQEASLRNYCDEHPMAEFYKAGRGPLLKTAIETIHATSITMNVSHAGRDSY